MYAYTRTSRDLERCRITRPTYSPERGSKYEMAMELLEVSDAAMAKYFTMMLDGMARSWLKGLPSNSIDSWAELKACFIQNFKDTCKQSMSIVDLTNCK